MLRALAGPSLLVVALATTTASAQPVIRAGTELQVNTVTSMKQQSFARAVDVEANGDYVVVWSSSSQDGSLTGVFAQRFASSGAKVGSDFQVNTYTTGNQTFPAVGVDADGDIVVVWVSSGQDGDGNGVFGRRFNSSGAALGGEFQVATATVNSQFAADVARDADGDFVVVWTEPAQERSFARRFNSSGTKLAAEFAVNVSATAASVTPAVDVSQDGDFVIAWTSGDISHIAIYGQVFTSTGARLNPEVQVSADYDFNLYPDVAVDADNHFVVAWLSYDSDLGGIRARSFDSLGVPKGPELVVNQFEEGKQYYPTVGNDKAGGFVVAWESDAQDGDGNSIFVRRIDSSGFPATHELQVNSYTSGDQYTAAVAGSGNGHFVVVWNSLHDGSGLGVFSQRFRSLGFLDIDGNGELTALTDGLLILRYLFGFTGSTLIADAVGSGCTRCDAGSILGYLQGVS